MALPTNAGGVGIANIKFSAPKWSAVSKTCYLAGRATLILDRRLRCSWVRAIGCACPKRKPPGMIKDRAVRYQVGRQAQASSRLRRADCSNRAVACTSLTDRRACAALLFGSVPIQLDTIHVRVVQVECFAHAVIGCAVERDAGIDQPSQCIGEYGAAWVEFTVEVPGIYTLVDHSLSRALDKGAVAQIVVTGEANPAIFDVPPGQQMSTH